VRYNLEQLIFCYILANIQDLLFYQDKSHYYKAIAQIVLIIRSVSDKSVKTHLGSLVDSVTADILVDSLLKGGYVTILGCPTSCSAIAQMIAAILPDEHEVYIQGLDHLIELLDGYYYSPPVLLNRAIVLLREPTS